MNVCLEGKARFTEDEGPAHIEFPNALCHPNVRNLFHVCTYGLAISGKLYVLCVRTPIEQSDLVNLSWMLTVSVLSPSSLKSCLKEWPVVSCFSPKLDPRISRICIDSDSLLF